MRSPPFALTAFLLSVAVWSLTAPTTTLLDRVVAQVNGEVIFLSELLEVEAEESEPAPTGAMRWLVRAALLERMIDARLLEQEATRLGFEPPEEEIAQMVDAQVRELTATWPDPYTFDALLATEGLTRASLRAQLREDEADAWLRRSLVISRMPSPPPDPDLDPLLGLSQIVLACPPGQSEAVVNQRYQECLTLRARAQGGESFAELAARHSDDPHTAPEGGAIGDMELRELDPGIARAIEDLQEGELSLPVRTEMGWHLLRVDRRITPRQRWRIQAFEETRDALMAELRARAHIETHLEE